MEREDNNVHAGLSAEVLVMKQDIRYIREAIVDLKDVIEKRDGKYATTERVQRLETVVYGGIGLIITGVVLAGLGLVLR